MTVVVGSKVCTSWSLEGCMNQHNFFSKRAWCWTFKHFMYWVTSLYMFNWCSDFSDLIIGSKQRSTPFNISNIYFNIEILLSESCENAAQRTMKHHPVWRTIWNGSDRSLALLSFLVVLGESRWALFRRETTPLFFLRRDSGVISLDAWRTVTVMRVFV